MHPTSGGWIWKRVFRIFLNLGSRKAGEWRIELIARWQAVKQINIDAGHMHQQKSHKPGLINDQIAAKYV